MSQIGTNYAQALYSLAKEENASGQILEQMDILSESFSQEPDFIKLLAAPNISKEERCRILDDSFRGRVHPFVLNFLKLLTEKGYIRHFHDCCRSYREQYNEDNGIICVRVITAVALTEIQKARLTEKLQTITGKTIHLKTRVDPTVLGGVRLDSASKQVDGTVQNRLDSVRRMLKNTVL